MVPDRDTSANPPDDAAAALAAARAWAEQRAFLLYEGKAVAHRSCGVASVPNAIGMPVRVAHIETCSRRP